jgi:hypothetical protein
MAKNSKKGIFCIEGEWEKSLKDRSSVQMLIEFLASNDDQQIAPIYRRVATKESFVYYLKRWQRHKVHTIGYFSFHGDKGELKFGEDFMSLAELGKLLEGKCQGKHIILASCKTLSISPNDLDSFLKITKAKSVSGYKKNADWIESSAFDCILMTNLLYKRTPSEAYAWLSKRCSGLIDDYGFVMKYKSNKA